MVKVKKSVKKRISKMNRLDSINSYPVGDFLIRIKNASMVNKKEFLVKNTRLIEALAKVLVKEKYLEKADKEEGNLKIRLAFQRKEPFLTDIKLVSKPGLRVYIRADELEKRKAASILILSTSKGIKSSKDAIKNRLGGEVIAEIL